MQQLLYFLLNYKTFVLIATFGILSITALVNFAYNPYGKQNAKLKRFNKKIVMHPSSVVTEIHILPKEYQRQWRAYVNSGCNKPSTVFEFVKLPTPYLLWFAHFAATATSTFYLVMAILLNYSSLFTTQIVFLLLSVMVVLVKNIINKINLAHARKIFGKFLHDLNRITQLYKNSNQQQNPVENHTSTHQNNASFDTQPSQQSVIIPHSEQISQGETSNETIVDKAVRILRQKGLENPRTVEEQRKLNLALNNLLQACCKRN